MVAVYTWEDFNGITGPGYHAMLGEELLVPPPLAITDVRYVGDPVAMVDRRDPLRRRGRVRARSRSTTTRRPRSSTTRGAAADTENIVHAGWGLESNAMVQVPFMPLSPDLDEVFANGRARRRVRRGAEPLRGDADGDARHRGVVHTRAVDELDIVCATQSVHETRNFFARYLQIPEGHVRVTARDVGGGFGQKMFVYREECAVVLASYLLGRPVKWIEDRRENLLSAGTRATSSRTCAWPSTTTASSRRSPSTTVRDVGAYPACPAAMDPMLLPGPYKIPRLGFSMEMVWTNTMGKARVPRAVDVRDHRARDGDRPRRRARSASTRRAPPAQPARGRRPPVHLAERQRVPGDHAARRRSSRRSRSSTTRRSARSRPTARAEGGYLGVGHLRVRGADVDGQHHARHRRRPPSSVETSGRVVAYLGTDVARPERRDHHGPDRRRAPRRRLRRRHHRAGRLAVDAVRPRHRREPHRGRRRRRGARGDRRRAREGARPSPRT